MLRARPGLRRQGRAHQRADARPERAAARHWCRRCCKASCASPSRRLARLPPAVHAAARPAAARRRRESHLRALGFDGRAGANEATCAAARPAPTRCCSPSWPPAARPQARPPAATRAAGHRLGQHRLHHAPAERHARRRCATGSSCWTRRSPAGAARRIPSINERANSRPVPASGPTRRCSRTLGTRSRCDGRRRARSQAAR